MIDIPGVYVGRFKDDPNQSTMLMKNGDTPTYTDDNWANVESAGTIWRYSSEAGEWIDTGLEEILVEEVTGTKEIVAEGTVPWKLQGLSVYGKSTQASTTGAQLLNISSEETFIGTKTFSVAPGTVFPLMFCASIEAEQGEDTIMVKFLKQGEGIYTTYTNPGDVIIPFTFNFEFDSILLGASDNVSNSQGKTVTYRNAMLNSGSTALPWEPYTSGQPSPSPDYPQEIVTAGSDGTIDITVSDNADQSQQLSISTPNGLPGIPISSGGNYTDADGQQWVCDEVDFEKGVYVKKVGKLSISDFTNMVYIKPGTTGNRFGAFTPNRSILPNQPALCNYFPFNDVLYGSYNTEGNYIATDEKERVVIRVTESISLENFHQLYPDLVAYYPFETSIETPLSEEELAAYAALMSYDGSTVISTDEDVSGISAKVVTDVISKNSWFDPYSELALYYKALAGFASLEDLPMPHSRESSLVRKLLDSSYELGFTVTETSSRNERYLWDLINGTTSMLTNVPKSDTEKFLHVMIGGTVEEYPTVDTELDYWMDKCVNYMNSNGSIGE